MNKLFLIILSTALTQAVHSELEVIAMMAETRARNLIAGIRCSDGREIDFALAHGANVDLEVDGTTAREEAAKKHINLELNP